MKIMKISDVGEDKFIETIKKRVGANQGEGVVGIGDDCAVVPNKEGYLTLLSTDSLVEGCHFIKDNTSARDLGFKAVMVNVSDVAAMGGKALYVLMSIAMPKETEVDWLNEYMDGVHEACEEVEIELIGGDTTSSKSGIFINFSIVGEVLEKNVKYRKNAQAGDVICLTDTLGDSWAGFELMMAGQKEGHLVEKHCHPRAAHAEGEWLGQQTEVRAMMDISDGLVQDLRRMMNASGMAAEVDLKKIPMSVEFKDFADKYDKSTAAEELAIESGEEYCLMLTVDPEKIKDLKEKFEEEFGESLYEIGIVKEGSGIAFFKNKKQVEIKSEGYLHFK